MIGTVEIILVFITSVLAVLTKKRWKSSKKTEKLISILGIITAATIAVNNFCTQQENRIIKKIEQSYGTIEDLEGAEIPLIEIGYAGTRFMPTNTAVFSIGSKPVLKAFIRKGELFVWTVIRNKAGKLVGVIDSNEWEVVDKSYDYNNDRTAFELVEKGSRKVIFQIELKNGIAHVSGWFMEEDGNGFYLCGYEDGAALQFKSPEKEINEHYIAPIFRYPRSMHYGKREE